MNKGILLDFHQEFFFPLVPTSFEEVKSALYLLRKIIGSAIGTTALAIALGSFSILVAIYDLYQEEGRKLMLLTLPILLTLIASYWQMYSIIPRLMLFFLPIIILLSGIGTLAMFKPLNKPLRILLLFFLTVIAINQKGYQYFWKPLQLEEPRPLLVDLMPLTTPDQVIYVDYEAKSAYLFYTQSVDQKHRFIPQTSKVIFANWDTVPIEALQQLDAKQAWIIFSHATPNRQNTLLEELKKYGKIEKELKQFGAAAFLITIP